MATWVEDNSSRSATFHRLGRRATSTYTKSFKVFGYTNDVDLQVDAEEKIRKSLSFFAYPGSDVRLTAESYSISYLGDDAWQVTINYEKEGADNESQSDPLNRSRSFDTSGGTLHITQAEPGYVDKNGTLYATGPAGVSPSPIERRYPATGPTGTIVAPQLNGAIGVDADTISGVDIIVPQLQWTEQYDVPSGYVTDNYIKTLAALTGTTNYAPFRSFQAGEVLFLGASGSQEWSSQRGDGPWSMTYKFSASQNLTNATIGSITGIAKRGHEYLWVRYEDFADDRTAYKRPRHVYVNRVYKEADWDGLGIGR